MNFGERISTLRKEKKMTQNELARKLYVTDKTISSWEQNRTEPNLESIIKLSEILEADINYLLNGENIKINKNIEIKIKISEKQYKYLDSFLQHNAKFKHKSNQHDIYYKINNNLKQWLRIRTHGIKKTLTYKKWNDNINCDKYDVNIDNIENLNKIFHILGLKKLVIVDKTRKIYNYNEYEVSLDKVKNLGCFVEIKSKKINKSLKIEYSKLLKIVKKLNLDTDKIETQRYPYIIMQKSNKNL